MKLHSQFKFLDQKVYVSLSIIWQNQNPLTSKYVNAVQPLREGLTDFLYKSLIYLGDLARYRQLHSEKKVRQWELARKFYTLAQHVVPWRGNTFNQLAVLDTYEGKELDAISMYLRSIVVRERFPTAAENILLLVDKAQNALMKNNAEFETLFIAYIGQILKPATKYFELISSDTFVRDRQQVMNQFREFLSNSFLESRVSNIFTILVSILHLLKTKPQIEKISFSTVSDVMLFRFLIDMSNILLEQMDKLNQERRNIIETPGMIDIEDSRIRWEQFLILFKLILKVTNSKLFCNYKQDDCNRFWEQLAGIGTNISAIKLALFPSNLSAMSFCMPEDELFVEFLPLELNMPPKEGQDSLGQDPRPSEFVQIRCSQIVTQLEAIAKEVSDTN